MSPSASLPTSATIQAGSLGRDAKPAFGPETSTGPGRCALHGPATQTHDLKCWAPYWDQINTGRKTFEIRENDRGYRVRDLLILREWIPPDWLDPDTPGEPTGRVCHRTVTSVLIGGKFGLAEGHVALSLQPVDPLHGEATR